MFRTLSFPSIVGAFAAVVSLTFAVGQSSAKDQPFSIVGAGVATTGLPLPGQPPREHWSVGVATHLGLYHGNGSVKTDTAVPDFANGLITGEFGSGSPYVFTAANGHKLVAWYGRTDHGADMPGEFELTILGANSDGSLIVQAMFIAEFVVDPAASTGRFAGAKGNWTMYAFTEPFTLGASEPLEYFWLGEGRINFKK